MSNQQENNTTPEVINALPTSPLEVSIETSTAVAERPAWLPEGFSTPEELVSKYNELTKQPTQAVPEAVKTPQELDFDKFYSEYATSGSLSEESYKELANNGLSKDFVNQYIEGQIALNEVQTNKGYAVVGGREAYNQMIEWAKVSLNQQEIEAFNSAVKGNTYQMQLAVQGLHARFKSNQGVQPNLIQGNNGSVGVSQGGFRSDFEMIQAINDPRYTKDSAFRLDVERRIALM